MDPTDLSEIQNFQILKSQKPPITLQVSSENSQQLRRTSQNGVCVGEFLVKPAFGCSWPHPIGNIESAERASSAPTFRRALLNIVDHSGPIATRDPQAEAVLQRNGIPAITVGDCAWYHLPSKGKPMRRPTELRNIAVTTPHAFRFKDQSIALIDMLKESWPSARIVLFLHSKNRKLTREISDYAKRIDVAVVEAAGKLEIFDEYEKFDLHIGHRLHGHIGFLRRRKPSILFMEDARSKGFAQSLPVGCFEANRSDHTNSQLAEMPIEDALPLVSADMAAVTRAQQFIEQEMQTGFARYSGVPKFLDTMLEDVFLPTLEARVRSVKRILGRPAKENPLARIFKAIGA